MKPQILTLAAVGGLASVALLTSDQALAQQAAPAPTEQMQTAVAPAAVAPAPVAAPVYAAAPVQLPGAVPGTTAADQNGDGIVDGYYTSDGYYHPFVAPVVQPVRVASRRGERG